MTPELAEQLWQEKRAEIERRYSCNCSNAKAVRRTRANGIIVVSIQCQKCGREVKTASKKLYDIDSLPLFDEHLSESFWKARQSAWEYARTQYDANIQTAREVQNRQWWEKYNQYLRSQQWHMLRKKVLDRDDELCQACLSRKATQVHHLFYDLYNQLGQSAAFECVAICHACHEKIHPHMAKAQHDLLTSGHNPYLEGARNGHR